MYYSQHSSQVLAGRRKRGGFTLVEILVVLAVIGILAAILLPVLNRTRETGNQTACAANLQQIYTAVKLYYDDEKRYPASLAVLLPQTANLSDVANSTASTVPANTINGQACSTAAKTCPNPRGSGHLTSSNALVCNSDDTISIPATMPRSSYGDISVKRSAEAATTVDGGHHVWNYWGYKNDGFAYDNADAEINPDRMPTAYATDLSADQRFWRAGVTAPAAGNTHIDPLKVPRLANRFAPDSTIITHCIFHRIPTAAGLGNPSDLYATAANDTGARDVVLRLNGSAGSVDVTPFKGDSWVKQIK